MDEKRAKALADSYQDLIEEGIKVADELDEKRSELTEFDSSPSSGRGLIVALSLLSFLAVMSTVYSSFQREGELLTREEADQLIFNDMKQTPRSPRAHSAARAVIEFTFSIDALYASGKVSKVFIDEQLRELRAALASTEEDEDLIALYSGYQLSADQQLTFQPSPSAPKGS